MIEKDIDEKDEKPIQLIKQIVEDWIISSAVKMKKFDENFTDLQLTNIIGNSLIMLLSHFVRTDAKNMKEVNSCLDIIYRGVKKHCKFVLDREANANDKDLNGTTELD